jgi:hypothetical protein
MSRDVQLAFPCPHLIGEERVDLGADRRTLYTSKPISGPNLLRVVANDEWEVSPYTGVVTTASVKSYRREPYKVTLANRTLVIRTGNGEATVTLPTGYLSALQVSSTLATAASSLVTVTTPDGYLTVTDKADPGPASRVQLSGSALEALGFDQQFGGKGRTVIPSWRLYSRTAVNPEDAVDSLGYYIGFDSPVAPGMYFTVTYPVAPNLCLRCLTTEVENDFRFDAQGDALIVRDENLLYQSCLKIILTEIKSNVYHSWYGSNLATLIGSKVVGASVAGIRQAVSTALGNLQSLQNAQAKYQRITAKERLFSVDNVSVVQSPSDPTMFFVEVSVRNYASEPVDISIVYTTPGTFALPGTNRLSLGNY